MTIKITALRRAYYNGEIIKPGQVITIKGDDVPSWSKKVTPEKTVKEVTKQVTSADVERAISSAAPAADEQKLSKLSDLTGKSEEELNKILDELITKGLELNILIDTENKTVIEQINELTAQIAKATEE